MISESAGHNAPCSNRDFDYFYAGLEAQRLLVQRCDGCGELRSLPTPGCGSCHSLDWSEHELSGQGEVFSFVIHHHPPLPMFEAPHPIALVAMREGVRLIGAMDGTDAGDVEIGMPVRVEFVRRGEVASFRFKKA